MQKAVKVAAEVTLRMYQSQAEPQVAFGKAILELILYGERVAEDIKLHPDLQSKTGNDEWFLRERKKTR